MWGNPMRERDFISFRKVYISSNNTISSKRNPLTAHKNCPHNILPWKTCQIRTVVRPAQKSTPWKMCPQSVVWPDLYGPAAARKTLQNSLENCAKLASISVPSFPCCMDCTDPYSTASNSSNNYQHSHRNIPLGFVPNLSWEMHPPCCPNFPLSSYLRNLSQSPSHCVLHTTQCILL
jgi:hypothetical protein